jgi:hypothetical protein
MRVLIPLESQIEYRTVQYATETYKMLQFKLTPMGQVGWQDRLFITLTGVHFYIEFKRRGERLRKIQDYRRWQLLEHKCNVHGPVDNWEQAKAIVDHYGTISATETGVEPP